MPAISLYAARHIISPAKCSEAKYSAGILPAYFMSPEGDSK